MDYASQVHRIRELVWEHVPAGSQVAVVSKGDPALILFDQRIGLHYPQAGSGQYLGHHPDTGAAAVAYLESMHVRGAEYLVIPAIYAWFLDYYSDLRSHLNREGELIYRDDVCAIYGLTKRQHMSRSTKTAVELQLRDLVAAVLPQGSMILALSWSHTALAGSGEFRLLEPPDGGGPADAVFPGLEAKIRDSGAQYVVVPAPAPGQTPGADDLVDRCRTTWTTVLDQRHVCAVFAIPAQAAGPAAARGRLASAGRP
jgi:hypothetical protein